MRTMISVAIALGGLASGVAQTAYQTPSPAIQKLLDIKKSPDFRVSPSGRHALIFDREALRPLSAFSRPMLRLAGHRVDPENFGSHASVTPGWVTHLSVMDLPGGRVRPLRLTGALNLGAPQWSPSGHAFVMVSRGEKALELWLGDPESGILRKIPGLRLNGVLGENVCWMPDGRSLVVKGMPLQLQPPPEAPKAPKGPRVEEHDASKNIGSPVGTHPDLLKNVYDEALFEYYATSQLYQVDLTNLGVKALGSAALLRDVQASPDGEYLLVSQHKKPFSYQVPSGSFPTQYEIWTSGGRVFKRLFDFPLTEGVPNRGVRKGPRELAWVGTEPATLYWAEALDEGNPRMRVPMRDRLVRLRPPFEGAGSEWLKTEHRFSQILPTERGRFWLEEVEPQSLRTRVWIVDGSRPEQRQLLWEYPALDRYRHPGSPLLRPLSNGQALVRESAGGEIWITGEGASVEGERPFLDLLSLATQKRERLFSGNLQGFEACVALLKDGSFITRRESPRESPNYILNRKGDVAKVLTFNADPAPEWRRIQKRWVRFERADGTASSFTLYLPADYRAGERRPALLWLKSPEGGMAGEGSETPDSAQRFSLPTGASPLHMAQKGYVVLHNVDMPLVGDLETLQESYLEQLIDGARSALEKAVEMGVIDGKRVAIGGNGKAAFWAANLVAHTDLFKCAIAQSGSYNRMANPFGFAGENLTLWEAPEFFARTSPVMRADRFKAPILLLHGEGDEQGDTPPEQAERLYQALRGNNQSVRLVSLPMESHQFRAKENIGHALWEMESWLDRHLR